MSKPTILTVDDDPMVLQAITRDLRARYGSDYRIVRATSGAEALAVLAELALRDRPVALIATDQRMPEMTGIEMLEQARPHAPGRQVPPAHRVRRHRRRHQGDQRHRPRLLPAQAVGPAGRAAVPRDRRPAGRLAAGAPAGHRRRAGGRAPLVGAEPRGQDVPGAQPRALPLARRRPGRRGAAAPGARARRGRRSPAGARARRRDPPVPVDARPRRVRSACAPAPSNRSTTCASSAAVRQGSPPRCTPRPRVCGPSWWSERHPGARPARAHRSRTTSASRRACPAPTSRTEPSHRRRASGRRWCWPATSWRSRRAGRCARCASATRRSWRRVRCSWRQECRTGVSRRPVSRRSPVAACTTARPRARRSSARATRCTSSALRTRPVRRP